MGYWAIFLLLPLYLLRMMGAGDVKLMAMVGAFVGPNDIFGVFLSTLIVGGLLALVVSWRQGMVCRLMNNCISMFLSALLVNKSKFSEDNFMVSQGASGSVGKLPYGIAITVGTIAFLMINHSNFVFS